MKKKRTFNVFAIIMTALLIFSGSAWAAPAQDDNPAARRATPEEYGIISGRVTDAAYSPVADVYVSVWDERGFGAGWDFTDRYGKYEIILPADNYKMIWFIPPEGVYLARTHIPGIVVVAGQTTTVDVTLEEGGLISGRVTNEAGVGVAHARIVPHHPILDMGGDWGIRTDADGYYTTNGLPAGTYEMWVLPPEGVYLAPARISDIVVVAGQTTTVDVTLKEGGLISGRVTCPDGHPVPDALVSVWDRATGARGRAWTDADGNYTTTGLPAGTYEMTVRPPRGVYLAPARISDIAVVAGQTTTVDVTLKEGGLISGRVTDTDGNPAGRISIHVWEEDTGDWVGHVWTADDGTYTIMVPSGTFRIFLQSPPGGPYLVPAWVRGIEVTAGAIATVDVILEAGGRVSGTITDPNGVGVAGAHVRIITDRSWWGTTTAADGSFTTIALLPGVYEMKVLPPDGVSLAPARILGIVIAAGETIMVNVALKLPGDATGDGRVDASDLAMVAGAFNTQDAAADINADGIVDIFDLVKVGRNFGKGKSP